MGLWLTRAGSHGECEERALANSIITMCRNEFPDLTKFNSKDGLTNYYFQSHPDAKKTQASAEVDQIWDFANTIQKGDLVILTLKTQGSMVIGEVSGPYEYKQIGADTLHVRQVKWLKKVPRVMLPQNILYALAACAEIYQIKDERVEEFIKDLSAKEAMLAATEPLDGRGVDVEQYSKDLIAKYIVEKFSENNLIMLIEAALQAQGYLTKRTSFGQSAMTYILASSANVGFDYPRILVYVKAHISALDIKELKDLETVMKRVKADQLMAVSCGGFTQKALETTSDTFFSTKLWDSIDLADALFRNYDRMNGDVKAALPLKKIWALAK